MRRWFWTGAVTAMLSGAPVRAETGMGLIIDDGDETVRRVDLVDSAIAHTSPSFGTNVNDARFSPGGDRLVYIDNAGEVFICDLDGNVLQSFSAWSKGRVSWTVRGIWVADIDRAVLYDATTAQQLDSFSVSYENPAHLGHVSYNELTGSAVTGAPWEAQAVQMNGGHALQMLGPGCSVGASPDGSRLTHNLWESGVEHQTMKIHARDGQELEYFYLFDLIPYPSNETRGWSWNDQRWSSNADDIILIPTGRGFPQMDDSKMPWIYNLATGEANCLHTDPYAWNVYWEIADYYTNSVEPRPYCSDGTCNGSESCSTCSADCGICATCGDGTCDDSETCSSCTEDCGVCPPTCGDSTCDADETCTSCPNDCTSQCGGEDAEATIEIVSPQIGDTWHAGETHSIRWKVTNVSDVVIMYSTDGAASWKVISPSIDDRNPSWLSFDWEIPNEPSDDAYLRIQEYFGTAPTVVGPFLIAEALPNGDTTLEPMTVGCASVPTPTLGLCLLVLIVVLRRRRPWS